MLVKAFGINPSPLED